MMTNSPPFRDDYQILKILAGSEINPEPTDNLKPANITGSWVLLTINHYFKRMREYIYQYFTSSYKGYMG